MRAHTKNNILYAVPAVLLISACMWVSSLSGDHATAVPLTPTVAATLTPVSTAGPTVAAGSFSDFRLFAAEIDSALQNKNVSFFGKYATATTWTCTGEEPAGVCTSLPADKTLEGIPVAYDWARYELLDIENYKTRWQTTFTSRGAVKLAAIAQRFGDNPFTIMAGQSFLAIVSIAEESAPASIQEVRVLFFEYYENSWHLAGELIVVEGVQAWIDNTCSMCYDTWEGWQK